MGKLERAPHIGVWLSFDSLDDLYTYVWSVVYASKDHHA